MAFTSIHASCREDWHFDNGCSRHMTGNSTFFSKFKECSAGHVTFCDEVKEKVLGKGNICKTGLPELQDIRLVKGLLANLISVNQQYNQVFLVNFSKDRCVKFLIKKRIRHKRNLVVWQFSSLEFTSLPSICKIIGVEVVLGIPLFKVESNTFFGECSAGKQIKAPHKSVGQCTTNCVLKLLYMDLRGPIACSCNVHS